MAEAVLGLELASCFDDQNLAQQEARTRTAVASAAEQKSDPGRTTSEECAPTGPSGDRRRHVFDTDPGADTGAVEEQAVGTDFDTRTQALLVALDGRVE